MSKVEYTTSYYEILRKPERVAKRSGRCQFCHGYIDVGDSYLDRGGSRRICMGCVEDMKKAMAKESNSYYLQESTGFIGNSVVWWRKGNKGYTANIEEAAVYTKEDAFGQHACRETDIPWPKKYVDSKIKKHVDIQDLDNNSNKAKISEMKKCTT